MSTVRQQLRKRERAQHWQTKFGRWVERNTVNGVRAQLNAEGHPLSNAAVYNWVLANAIPRADVALTLERISNGKVKLADIIEHRRAVRDGAGNAAHGSVPGAEPAQAKR